MEALRAAIGEGGPIDSLVAKVDPLRPPFTFDVDAVMPAGRSVTGVEIRTNSYWRFGWKLNETGDGWTRQDAGKTVTDEVTEQPVTAANIIVQRVKQEVVFGDPDPGGYPATPAAPGRRGRRDALLRRAGDRPALVAADGRRWHRVDLRRRR